MSLSPDQQRVLQRALSEAARRGASPRERKALVLALGVESNYRDLPGGDRDSVGALQQRPSQGWGPASESLETDVGQFLDRARKANTGRGSAGQLAQSVQRSAFPDRYDQRSSEADEILGHMAQGPFQLSRDAGNKGPVSNPDVRSILAGALEQTPPRQTSPIAPPAGGLTENPFARQLTATSPRAEVSSIQEKLAVLDSATPGPGGDQSFNKPVPLHPGDSPDGAIIPFSQLAHQMGLKTTSGERDTKLTASGGISDHWKGKPNATARDWAGDPEAMDRTARTIARELGIKDYQPGQIANVVRDGHRYQLIWNTPDHRDHIHLGVTRAK